MSAIFYLSLPLAVLALYWFVIRPRGAHMLATYRAAGGGWAGVKAVLWGYQTWWATFAGAVAVAAPELLTVAAGVDFKPILGERWGATVATALAIGLPIMRAFSATPTHKPPSGEA